MAEIVPAILAATPADFAAKLQAVKPFAKRIHIDITDGIFAPSQTINLAQVYGLEGVQMDLHLMLQKPSEQLETIVSLHPDLVILHQEADDDLALLFEQLQKMGIKVGLGILPDTAVGACQHNLQVADHALVFTGHLGYYGGQMDQSQLSKIAEIKAIKPVEVSVDGGVNPGNAATTVAAGADVLISGGFIAESADPKAAYQQLMEAAQ